jgi:predicted Zn-dependent peptidase
MPSELFPIHRKTLPSGLRLLVVPTEGTGAVTLFITVRTGSRNEVPREMGISHFLEHLFFKGSKKRPTTRMISESLDQVGGDFNAFTSKEMTAFWAKSASQHAALLLDVLGDMLLHPLFDPKEIDRERGVITEEMNMYEDTPLQSIDEHFEELLFGSHPLGRKIIGTKEIIARLPRSAFLRYIGAQYGTKNTVVCLAGNISADEGFRLLADMLGKFPKGHPAAPAPFKSAWGKKRVAVREKKTDQAHMIVGGRGLSYLHPDRTVADVLASILGGSMSSRLFIEVRERRGLAYSVRTQAEHFTDTGYVGTQAGVDPGKLEAALRVILREYAKIRDKDVPAAELLKAKEGLKGRLLLRLESSDAVAQFVAGQELLTDRILTIDDVFARIEAVTARDIRRVAKQLLAPSALRIAAIAPNARAARLEKLLR